MDIVENPMVLPEYEVKSKVIPDDVWAELEDIAYETSED